MPELDLFLWESVFSIRRWDLDRNGHVNNAVYFSWAIESVPDETERTLGMVSVEAEYLKPTAKNGDVRVRTASLLPEEEKNFFHVIIGPEGNENTKFITSWRTRL
jgi:acyl-ACP thioesterase